MKRGRTLIGLTVLCALAFSAISAASASAKGTTAFTCVPGGGGANTNAHCDPGSSGTSGHVSFAAGTKTHLHISAVGEQVLKGTLAGVAVELASSEVEAETSPNTSYIENNNTSPMDVTGTLVLHYKNVEIKASAALKARCTIENMEVTTTPLSITSSTGETKKTTGITFKPQSGAFAHIKFVTNPNPHEEKLCPLAGTEATVEGSVTGNTSGATLTVDPESSSLTLGGNAATLQGTVTVAATDPGIANDTPKPISLTTTEP